MVRSRGSDRLQEQQRMMTTFCYLDIFRQTKMQHGQTLAWTSHTDYYGYREINENFMALLPLFHLSPAHCARRGSSADGKIKWMRAGCQKWACTDSGGKLQLVIKSLFSGKHKNRHEWGWFCYVSVKSLEDRWWWWDEPHDTPLGFFGGLWQHICCVTLSLCSNPLGFSCDFFTFCLCFLIFG